MTIWQQLGAFVVTGENLSDDHLDRFAACGGRWIVVVLMNDNSVAQANLARIDDIKARANARGIRVGAHVNGFGDDPTELATRTRDLCVAKKLAPVIFDLELQYKDANAPLLPATLAEARRLMPGRAIGVTSFGFADRAMIWNGRTLQPPASLYDLKVRWIPQWYPQYDAKYDAAWSMQDLRDYGAADFNIADASAPGGRGIPLSYAHGVVEATGVEGTVLADILPRVRAAKAYGFSYGFSLWVLERTPPSDFAQLAGVRGELFLA